LNAAVRHPPIVESPAASSLTWLSEADTQEFAHRLAACPALRHSFVQLHGELGAGKTTLVRHLLHALGVQGRIKSPTYTVVEPYELPLRQAQDGRLSIWHFDFYRFSDPREWEDAGFRDIFASPGLKLAEWPEQAAAYLPPADLEIHIAVAADDTRQVTLVAHTDTGRALMQAASAAHI
jgi:tRNA threonylcarbamoyladenosine biosynthesis protein TsaE